MIATPVAYLAAHQSPGGGFAEPGGTPSPQLTAWAVLGLRAAGVHPNAATLGYLQAYESDLSSATDVELAAMAEAALGAKPGALLVRIHGAERASGAIGPGINSTAWGILALRQARERAPKPAVRYLLRHQARSGGWSWSPGGQPDSNDTAAAVEALRSSGVKGAPIRRALAYLGRLRNRDGGFELTPGRGSDAQSTAWAIQAFAAARRKPPAGSLAYLKRLRRQDGSFRYSTRYATTPVWVTAQVLPALSRRPFPL
ncbi:MAG TPA: prenyltransferase/squalene oxidase repeat-containing protein [Gaiellaceae bacterium]|nr:prenyltransferase/squalene oxidase repeat-containing protein [Gaiellaceae bacterium]